MTAPRTLDVNVNVTLHLDERLPLGLALYDTHTRADLAPTPAEPVSQDDMRIYHGIRITSVRVGDDGEETEATPLTDEQLTAMLRSSDVQIAQHFAFSHLPSHLASVSKLFAAAALAVLELPDNDERANALRKLLEAKDAAVRARIEQ